jgi:hypothetical protein
MDERTAPSLQEALSVVKLQSSLMMRNLVRQTVLPGSGSESRRAGL